MPSISEARTKSMPSKKFYHIKYEDTDAESKMLPLLEISVDVNYYCVILFVNVRSKII